MDTMKSLRELTDAELDLVAGGGCDGGDDRHSRDRDGGDDRHNRDRDGWGCHHSPPPPPVCPPPPPGGQVAVY